MQAWFQVKKIASLNLWAKKPDYCFYLYYVTFICMSLNKNCFLFIQVMQRKRREDGHKNVAGISKMSARIIICYW
jgi:hypothetical protein